MEQIQYKDLLIYSDAVQVKIKLSAVQLSHRLHKSNFAPNVLKRLFKDLTNYMSQDRATQDKKRRETR
ncbi:hypothetical protein ACH3XW_9095 [Acanthocheilonema viteae]